MSIIRTKNNVPQPYVSESRDFQIFTRVLDLVQNGVKFNVDSILNIVDTETIPTEYLTALKSKLGFFSTNVYEDSVLRQILSAFPHIIRHKGSEIGIHMCINTFLNILGLREGHKVDIINVPDEGSEVNDAYTVVIGLESNLEDTTILEDLLSYVLPIGYFVKFYFYKESDNQSKGDVHKDRRHFLTTLTRDDMHSLRSAELGGVGKDTYNTVQLSTVYDEIEDTKVDN